MKKKTYAGTTGRFFLAIQFFAAFAGTSAAVAGIFVALGFAFTAFLAEIVGFLGGRTFVAAGVFEVPAADGRGDLFVQNAAEISGVFESNGFRSDFLRFVEDNDTVRSAQWVERSVRGDLHWSPVDAALDLQVQSWDVLVDLNFAKKFIKYLKFG